MTKFDFLLESTELRDDLKYPPTECTILERLQFKETGRECFRVQIDPPVPNNVYGDVYQSNGQPLSEAYICNRSEGDSVTKFSDVPLAVNICVPRKNEPIEDALIPRNALELLDIGRIWKPKA